ncbi:hypothetical protein [Dysgonomonas termitidis]|uniref:Uncharacterized protein n=1 Tax=Dysgonomonas termitidis TaxID=1516126 RepID=A0ABV9KRL8_9BACT
MGFNRYHHLLKVRDVCEIFEMYKKKGLPSNYIHANYIYPKYFIGIKTVYNYLGIPYKKQIEEFEKEMNKAKVK